jgi:hypothetical protein
MAVAEETDVMSWQRVWTKGPAFAAAGVGLVLALCGRPAHAQGRDPLLNGALIGAAVGAGAGIGFTYAVRDSDLGISQYGRGALIFGAIGSGVGLGVDALLTRASHGSAPRRVVIVPAAWRHVGGVAVAWRW